MITEIDFLSVDKMKAVKPQLDTIVVSILDCSENHRRPVLRGFRSVLCLSFEDTYEEAKLAVAGDWPDEPSVLEHKKFAQRAGEKIPALSDALNIVSFLRKHQESCEPLKLVVHCFGGISRSAAIAMWACETFHVSISNAGARASGRANKRVLRLLEAADKSLKT